MITSSSIALVRPEPNGFVQVRSDMYTVAWLEPVFVNFSVTKSEAPTMLPPLS